MKNAIRVCRSIIFLAALLGIGCTRPGTLAPAMEFVRVPTAGECDPVVDDPPGTDLAFPDSLASVAITSGRVPHPTLVLLHGHAGAKGRNIG